MPGFTDAYSTYLENALRARAENKLEQERKRLFFGFLQEGFDIRFDNYEIEKRVRLPQSARGYVDALFGDLVFEFKQDIEKAPQQTRDQLLAYLTSDDMRHHEYLGIITDGLNFEVYQRDDKTLRLLDTFKLEADKPIEAFARLDSYLFSQKAQRPTASDIVFRFGASSPSFKAAFERLHALLKKTNYTALKVWREQWDKLLSKVYGDRVTGDEGDALYIKHTYLCQFAKLLAYGALNGRAPRDAAEVERIIKGDAFTKDRVSNIGESDFFSWVLLDDIKAEALELFRRLAAGLIVYNLNQIDQDLLKQLYQNLVDPSTRHDLGEYYTPDWLAELVLEDINYVAPQSLLDPACGSGSFLFAAIKRLEQNGLHGAKLVEFAANNIMGMDVHPLAVTIARLNYVLALSTALRTTDANRISLFPVPIYMADALQETGRDLLDKQSLIIPVRDTERFSVPLNIARHASHYAEIIETMEQTARSLASDKSNLERYSAAFVDYVKERSDPVAAGLFDDMRDIVWNDNVRLLARLIEEGRNGIWAYILKNQARPLMLAEHKFDVIVGNPPWLSYRYIKNAEYQTQVKRLSVEYGLIASNDRKLFTQIELCTLFAVHAEKNYLCEGGTMALVMPRSVITGAKQHRAFQAKGLTRVIDLLGVGPLFNVPSCVTIIQDERTPAPVPSMVYSGRLPFHEMSLPEARPYLSYKTAEVRFVDSDIRSPYHPLFLNGAGLYPRNLCFVAPEGDPASPMFITDPDADREAKKPYKGIKLRGQIDRDYLYATLLSKHLMPFGHEKLHLVALPVRLQNDGSPRLLTREADFVGSGRMHFQSWQWFDRAARQWDNLSSAKMSFFEQLNYQNKITGQRPLDGYRVVYNSSGVHLAACVVPPILDSVHGRKPQALIVDFKTYFYSAQTADEAHYLCALLNASSVDTAIKAYQSRGKGNVGERDIGRTPFEACAIPPFDAANATHQALAALSQSAHEAVAALKEAGGITGGVVSIRRKARAAVESQLGEIDALARDLLGLSPLLTE